MFASHHILESNATVYITSVHAAFHRQHLVRHDRQRNNYRQSQTTITGCYGRADSDQ